MQRCNARRHTEKAENGNNSCALLVPGRLCISHGARCASEWCDGRSPQSFKENRARDVPNSPVRAQAAVFTHLQRIER